MLSNFIFWMSSYIKLIVFEGLPSLLGPSNPCSSWVLSLIWFMACCFIRSYNTETCLIHPIVRLNHLLSVWSCPVDSLSLTASGTSGWPIGNLIHTAHTCRLDSLATLFAFSSLTPHATPYPITTTRDQCNNLCKSKSPATPPPFPEIFRSP